MLVLYDATQTFTNAVMEHLQSLAALPGAEVFFCHARAETSVRVPLELFDAVIVHYSVRIAFDKLSPADSRALGAYKGLKGLFIQDEYDYTENSRQWMERLGLDLVFTCVPPEHRESIYPTKRFPRVTFVTNLTGYVPAFIEHEPRPRPLAERPILIGYRGRNLPVWYGQLGQEKSEIGVKMRELCLRRGLAVDIAWDEGSRIYGDAWYEFLGGCRATLGTESGSNVFDDDGSLRKAIQAHLASDPALSFTDVFERYLRDVERPGLMNQASPKIFEAIALRTALILFEGGYSGVVEPERHYLPLKKDFSNVDEVLLRLQDDEQIAEMTDRAHRDVIASGRYSYRAFSGFVAKAIRDGIRERRGHVASKQDNAPRLSEAVLNGSITAEPLRSLSQVGSAPGAPTRGLAQRVQHLFMPLWLATPESLRETIRPAARSVLRTIESVMPSSKSVD